MENGKANSVRNALTQEFGPVPDTARYYKVRFLSLHPSSNCRKGIWVLCSMRTCIRIAGEMPPSNDSHSLLGDQAITEYSLLLILVG